MAGANLAREYYGRPKETNESFIHVQTASLANGVTENTSSTPSAPVYVRLYRTGDFGWREGPTADAKDPVFHYTGRRDQQMKINGCRVDTLAIELHAANVPGVLESCIVPFAVDRRCADGTLRQQERARESCRQQGTETVEVGARGEKQWGKQSQEDVVLQAGFPSQRLCLFVTPKRIPTLSVLTHLRAHLPHFMMPSRVVPLKVLPRLSNGKLDRTKLSRMAAQYAKGRTTNNRAKSREGERSADWDGSSGAGGSEGVEKGRVSRGLENDSNPASLEERMVRLIQNILSEMVRGVLPHQISVTTSLQEMGIDSMEAMVFKTKLDRSFAHFIQEILQESDIPSTSIPPPPGTAISLPPLDFQLFSILSIQELADQMVAVLRKENIKPKVLTPRLWRCQTPALADTHKTKYMLVGPPDHRDGCVVRVLGETFRA